METTEAMSKKEKSTIQKDTLWTLDPAHTKITFRVRHLMITNVTGQFNKFNAEVHTSGDDFRDADIAFSMDPTSIFTGDEKRDGHLKSADFFDVEHHGDITFKSSSMKKLDVSSFELSGDLTMKGISRPVSLSVEYDGMMKDPWGVQKAGFTLTGKINRKDWDLNWNVALESGGVLVGDIVTIMADVELLKQDK
jgi:polyisoprenoid-binding protein YceI